MPEGESILESIVPGPQPEDQKKETPPPVIDKRETVVEATELAVDAAEIAVGLPPLPVPEVATATTVAASTEAAQLAHLREGLATIHASQQPLVEVGKEAALEAVPRERQTTPEEEQKKQAA